MTCYSNFKSWRTLRMKRIVVLRYCSIMVLTVLVIYMTLLWLEISHPIYLNRTKFLTLSSLPSISSNKVYINNKLFKINNNANNTDSSTIDSNHYVELKLSSQYTASQLKSINSSNHTKIISSLIYDELLQSAYSHPRKRKMVDLTKSPRSNLMQTLINTWIEGSYSPIHRHETHSEAFMVLHGALALFTFNSNGSDIKCNILHNIHDSTNIASIMPVQQVMIIEKQQWHGLTAAPTTLGYPGQAIVFETNGRMFDPTTTSKTLAPFAPIYESGVDGDPTYYAKIMQLCPSFT